MVKDEYDPTETCRLDQLAIGDILIAGRVAEIEPPAEDDGVVVVPGTVAGPLVVAGTTVAMAAENELESELESGQETNRCKSGDEKPTDDEEEILHKLWRHLHQNGPQIRPSSPSTSSFHFDEWSTMNTIRLRHVDWIDLQLETC